MPKWKTNYLEFQSFFLRLLIFCKRSALRESLLTYLSKLEKGMCPFLVDTVLHQCVSLVSEVWVGLHSPLVS